MENLMSQAAPNLPNDARQRIDDHLDAIERVLIRGNISRAERRSIVDEVESQIYDMLAARPDQEPVAAVGEVLSSLDAPDAYAPGAEATAQPVQPIPIMEGTTQPRSRGKSAPADDWSFPSPRRLWSQWRQWWAMSPDTPRLSPPALVAAFWAGTMLLILMATIATMGRHGPYPLCALLLAVVGLPAPIGVTVLGFLAVRRIRRPDSKEHGLPLALIETFFFPILLANLALIGVLAASREAGLVLLAALVIIAANVGLARYAWRRFGGQLLSRIDTL
jgi:hypothetical protein